MTNRIGELDAIVSRFDLNEHPFYTEWRAGTLPIERLAEYADEWRPFIAVVDQGWEPGAHWTASTTAERRLRALRDLTRWAGRPSREAAFACDLTR